MPAPNAPEPTPTNMYPSCDTVEYAKTFLMSFCASPIVAAKKAVAAHWRTQSRHPEPNSLDDTPEECIAGDTDGPETVHERRHVQEGVKELVCRLSPKLREPVVLFWFKEMSVAEIARLLERPDSTVRDQLKEAMRELRVLVRARPDLEAMR